MNTNKKARNVILGMLPCTARAIQDRLAVHRSTVMYHLRCLMHEGAVVSRSPAQGASTRVTEYYLADSTGETWPNITPSQAAEALTAGLFGPRVGHPTTDRVQHNGQARTVWTTLRQ